MDAHIIFAALAAIDRQPIDKVRISRAAAAPQQGDPAAQRIDPPAEARHRAFDARAGCAIEPVGCFLDQGLQPFAQHHQRFDERLKCPHQVGNRLDQRCVEIGIFGFEAIAAFGLPFVAGINGGAHGGEHPFGGPRWHAFVDAAQPAVAGQRLCRLACRLDRKPAFFVIAGDIGEPRRKPAPPTAGLALGADHPAANFDHLRAGQCGGKGRIGCVEQVVPFVKDDARRAACFLAPARCVDHHQRMVGDDDVGLCRGTAGPLDEAFAVMRAARIDALAAPVGERGRAVAPEQGRQPAGQIAADHVAIGSEGRPTCDQMCEDRCPPCKTALQRVFKVQKAEIVFAPFSDDNLLPEGCIVGEHAPRFAHQLALQRLGIGRNPDRAVCLLRPKRGGGEVAQRLADACACLSQQHIWLTLAAARIENMRSGFGKGALAFADFGLAARQPGELRINRSAIELDRAGRGAWRGFFPFRQL